MLAINGTDWGLEVGPPYRLQLRALNSFGFASSWNEYTFQLPPSNDEATTRRFHRDLLECTNLNFLSQVNEDCNTHVVGGQFCCAENLACVLGTCQAVVETTTAAPTAAPTTAITTPFELWLTYKGESVPTSVWASYPISDLIRDAARIFGFDDDPQRLVLVLFAGAAV